MNHIVVAKVLVFNDHEELLIVRRSKTAPRRPLEWDFPGGFVDEEDESLQAAGIREVREETGIRIQHNKLCLAFAESAVTNFGGDIKDVTWLYFEGKAMGDKVILSFEHDAYQWVTLVQAQDMITYDTQLHAIQHLRQIKSNQ